MELNVELNKKIRERDKINNSMKIYSEEKDIINNGIIILENDVKNLKQKLEIYKNMKPSELQLEYENLEEKIEKLKNSHM